VLRVDPSAVGTSPDRLAQFYTRLQERLRQVPGVVDATYALYSPMEGNNWSGQISIAGRAVDPQSPDGSSWNRVGPHYFRTVGTPVIRGRGIDDRDGPAAARVVVVSQAFVKRFFDKADPIGRRLGFFDASHSGDFEIVGVVEDVKYTNASQPVRPMIFVPAFQTVEYTDPSLRNVQARSITLLRAVVVKTGPRSGNLEGALRTAVAEVNPEVTIIRVMPMAMQVSGNFRIERLMARLTTIYGLLALGLASLGLYGVTAYGVSQRTREIGVRMALGANRGRIIATVVRGPVVETVAGLAIGLPIALFAGRAISAQLFGIGGQSAAVFGPAILVLIATTAVAAMIPAARAASIDPTRALRGE
jgi:predicted permease